MCTYESNFCSVFKFVLNFSKTSLAQPIFKPYPSSLSTSKLLLIFIKEPNAIINKYLPACLLTTGVLTYPLMQPVVCLDLPRCFRIN